jgi:hypothetical protein
MKIVFAFLLACLALPCHAGKLAGPAYVNANFPNRFPLFYFYGAVDATRGKAWCPPKEMQIEEIHNIVVTKRRNIPEDRSLGTALMETLEKEFPCGNVKTDVPPEMTWKRLAAFSGKYLGDYLYGVSDSTRGKAWCLRRIIKPDEVNGRVYEFVSKLPPERLYENAAALTLEALHNLAPCRKSNPSTRKH